MNWITSHLLLLALMAGPASLVHAEEDAAARGHAERLVEALGAPRSFEQQVMLFVANQIQAQPEVVAYRDVITDFYRKYVGWEAQKEYVLTRYMEEFSTDELKALADFYGTPLGKRSLRVLPTVASSAMEKGFLQSQENGAELQAMIEAKAEILNAP